MSTKIKITMEVEVPDDHDYSIKNHEKDGFNKEDSLGLIKENLWSLFADHRSCLNVQIMDEMVKKAEALKSGDKQGIAFSVAAEIIKRKEIEILNRLLKTIKIEVD